MKKPSFLILAFALFPIAFLTSCSTMTTATGTVGKSGQVEGIIYRLPVGKIRLVGTPDQNSGGLFKISITAECAADPTTEYYLSRSPNSFFDDETKLTVNAKGLLQTAHGTSEDKSAAIAAEAANLASNVLSFGAGGPSIMVDSGKPESGRSPFNVCVSVEDWDLAIAKLKACGFNLGNLEIVKATNPLEAGPLPDTSGHETATIDGVAFRPTVACKVRIIAQNGGELETATILLPDIDRTYAIATPRGPFVKNVTNIGFSDGILTSLDQTRPSPIYGFIGIPKTILKAIVPIPGVK